MLFKTKPRLTIVILTYNSSKVIEDCLNNINSEKYKIVIVDNASKDNTVDIIKAKFPKISLTVLPKNVGYGNGNNVALEKVNTEFALILNPDARIASEDIEMILEAMDKNRLAATAGPLVLDHYPLNQKELDAKLANMNEDLNGIRDTYYEKIDGNFYVRFIIGAALFMRIPVMRQIGFFDKKIFLFYEDDELCGRVMAKGYQNIIVPAAHAFHIGGESCGSGLKVTYIKSWHMIWSKLYWKKLRKGTLRAKRSAFKFVLVYFVKTLACSVIFKKEKAVKNYGSLCGSFCSLIGLGSFKKTK